MRLITAVLLTVFLAGPSLVAGDCIWYGTCRYDGIHYQNCPYDGPGYPLDPVENPEAIEIIQRRCPEYYTSTDDLVCCTPQSLQIMDDSISYAEAVYGRCPTCLKNIIRSICAFSCSPNASNYTNRYTTQDFNGVEYIHAIDFRTTETYLEGVFNSCSNVVHPSSGKKVLDIACGQYDSYMCDPMKWFTFMGDASINTLAPFTINYYIHDVPEERFNGVAKTCDETYEGDYQCSCVDCNLACPVGEEPQPDSEPFMILEVNGFSFLVGVIVGVIGVCYITVYFITSRVAIKWGKPKAWLSGFDGIHVYLTAFFEWWGEACAKNAVLTLAICSYVLVALCYGIFSMNIITDPVELWASPDSQSRVEKAYFDSRFGPFYRTEQIFFKPYNQENFTMEVTTGNRTFGPAMNKEFLIEVFKLQLEIEKIGTEEGKGLDKICFAPVVYPGQETTAADCTVQSILGYFQNDLDKFIRDNNYLETIIRCSQNAYNIDCLAPYGGPIEAGVVYGGMPKPEKGANPEYTMATGLAVTFMVTNREDKSQLVEAMEWEKKFVEYMKTYENELFDFAFSSERSIEDGIQELSDAEMSTVIISYVVMFVYITLALGKFKGFRHLLMESKIILAVGGIVVVLGAVGCSLGLFGYLGVATTMLTIEVIPFLVLAIGVDNIFIFVHAYNRIPNKSKDTIEKNIGTAMGQVGPSILLCTCSEICCFAIGSLSDMPAVNTFAIYAAVAVFMDFVFQITAFVAIMCLDQKRYQTDRMDLFCCVQSKRTKVDDSHERGLLERFVADIYTPFIMRKGVQYVVLVFFTILTCASIVVMPSVEPGLDQELSMAKDHHVVKYFQFMADILSTGPPVYFVLTNGLDYMNETQQNYICGGVNCNQDSLYTQIYLASNYPDLTSISRASSSWLDDYIDYLNVPSCCRVTPDGEFCPSTNKQCASCDRTIEGIRPDRETFTEFFEWYLADLPDENCAKAGRAAYAAALTYFYDENAQLSIGDTYYMTYHTTCITSKEFYTALVRARELSADINAMLKENNLGVEVFPYSIFYVFYEQYLTIWEDAVLSLGLSLLCIAVVTYILTGFNLIFALVVLFMVLLIVINMVGVMWLWNITLNAVSLVNLVVAVGIGVEFVSHIVRAYTTSIGTKRERAAEAMARTGSSVFSGITLTKFAGIIVLGFAKSQIFQVFYFRMYLSIVILGAAHGLILLPVFLCYLGPPTKRVAEKPLLKR